MTDAVEKARSLLVAPEVRAASPWGALFAAGLCASAAVLMAGAVILGPGVVSSPAGAAQPFEP
ncbi:MAG: peptidoglycan-binding protein [Brevundimonas sp.]|uniref:peptidoglycan-binding protein n=1 Tax=Brevundimonas sp. TaxID=1871086 RepID=UPI0025C186F2|nr:peptidoglycan-binding protein [Brevundimonas sp.]MBX3476700.1 peptidoglycan-binding protein [Brevundimonas sp.]